MTSDITSQLIQRILSQLSQDNPDAASIQKNTISFLGTLDGVVGIGANYAQILSLGIPIAGADAVVAAAAQAAAAGGTGAATAAAAAAAASGGPALAIVALISFTIAILSQLTSTSDNSTAALQELINLLVDTKNVIIANYWTNQNRNIESYWDVVYNELDDLKSEGPQGYDVQKRGAAQYHWDAHFFVTYLIDTTNGFWQRPYVQGLEFNAQNVPYILQLPGITMGWYGSLTAVRQTPYSSQGANYVNDCSMLPLLLLAIESYLTIEELVNQIDPSAPTFSEFLTDFNVDLQNYAEFLQKQVELAMNGLVKSDIPSFEDVMGFINYKNSFLQYQPASGAGASSFLGGSPQAGQAWNGVYGVVDKFGFYESPVPIPSSASSNLINLINTDNLETELWQASQENDNFTETLPDWTFPWVQNRLTLGLMARWKALYLFNGYDKAWSVLQSLRVLAKLPLLPTPTLNQDGTRANGNWSVRELCIVLNAGEVILDVILNGPLQGSIYESYYSLFSLVQRLDNIANGNWVGPPSYSVSVTLGGTGQGLSRPVGFRERLAAAAV